MKLSRTRVDDGLVMYAGVIAKVAFEIQSDEKMKIGRGQLIGAPELMRDTFRPGPLTLKLAEGSDQRIPMVAHTEGGERANFEIEACAGRFPATLRSNSLVAPGVSRQAV